MDGNDNDGNNNGMQEPQTPDELLEQTRQDPLNASVGDDPMTEDNDSPAAPATDVPPEDLGDDSADDMHPSQDTDVDPSETYDQGSPS
jgi:hypothetical protein